MKRGKASDDKKRKKVDKRRESVERCEKSKNDGMKVKVLCTTWVVKEQRDANIAVENIESVSETVLHLARDALPVEL